MGKEGNSKSDINQCDGCLAGFPLDGLYHIVPLEKRQPKGYLKFDPFYNFGRIHMICQKKKYE
jgi:hypothetical protein